MIKLKVQKFLYNTQGKISDISIETRINSSLQKEVVKHYEYDKKGGPVKMIKNSAEIGEWELGKDGIPKTYRLSNTTPIFYDYSGKTISILSTDLKTCGALTHSNATFNTSLPMRKARNEKQFYANNSDKLTPYFPYYSDHEITILRDIVYPNTYEIYNNITKRLVSIIRVSDAFAEYTTIDERDSDGRCTKMTRYASYKLTFVKTGDERYNMIREFDSVPVELRSKIAALNYKVKCGVSAQAIVRLFDPKHKYITSTVTKFKHSKFVNKKYNTRGNLIEASYKRGGEDVKVIYTYNSDNRVESIITKTITE